MVSEARLVRPAEIEIGILLDDSLYGLACSGDDAHAEDEHILRSTVHNGATPMTNMLWSVVLQRHGVGAAA